MAITSYSELQTAAANWLVRADLTARIPEFISLAEARLNRVVRKRQAEADISLTGVPNSRFVTLPAAYSEALTCWITIPGSAQRYELNFVDPAKMDAYTTVAPGQPFNWTIDGTNLAFERPLDQAYALTLRCLTAYALSNASPTNALLADAPDVYLFAVLAEAGPFLRDADLAAAYEQKLSRAIAELNGKDARSRAPQNLVTEAGQLQRLGGRRGVYSISTDR
jgi:hypothetical protein